jgi:hypothetical protein
MKLKDLVKIKGYESDLVRLGPKKDGGYVINNSAISSSDILYTYGVGDNYEFEVEYFNLFKNKIVRMFDPTIGVLDTDNPSIHFYQDGLYGRYEGNTSFDEHISKFQDENKKVFLKIDVEGSEYNFFKFVDINSFTNVTGMVVEFHELYYKDKLEEFKKILSKILEKFDITHIHGNNFTAPLLLNNEFTFPSTPEISFLRKDLNPCKEYSTREYPLKDLDYKNAVDREEISFVIY